MAHELKPISSDVSSSVSVGGPCLAPGRSSRWPHPCVSLWDGTEGWRLEHLMRLSDGTLEVRLHREDAHESWWSVRVSPHDATARNRFSDPSLEPQSNATETAQELLQRWSRADFPNEITEVRSPEELLDALAKKKRTGGTVGTKITDAARGDITRMSDNSYTNGIINSSSRSTSTSSSSDGDAPSIPWRRYIFFGPRDDREALDKKRTKATE